MQQRFQEAELLRLDEWSRYALRRLRSRVYLFAERMRLLETLGSGALQPQHWSLIFDLLSEGLAKGQVRDPMDGRFIIKPLHHQDDPMDGRDES